MYWPAVEADEAIGGTSGVPILDAECFSLSFLQAMRLQLQGTPGCQSIPAGQASVCTATMILLMDL